jgi:hypothetical protein
MQPDTFRTLAEYIHELRRRDRDNYPTGKHPAFDTTLKDHSNRNQGHRSRDAGRVKNTPG